MVLYRPHRGSLDAAMAEVIEVRDRDELIRAMIRGLWNRYPETMLPTPENLTIEPYGYDDRIKWDTYIVCVHGVAWGFTNGPIGP